MKKLMVIILVLAAMLLFAASALANSVPAYNYASPLFGLEANRDGSLLVADAGAGIVELRNGEGSLIAELPGVADLAPLGRGTTFAITSGGPDPSSGKLYRIARGKAREIADLSAFEAAVNPDGAQIDSNPYGMATLSGGEVLVADAAANALLIADQRGNVDWVATFPSEMVTTANIKSIFGCPPPPPEPPAFDEFNPCTYPDLVPAEAVPTSVAIGPDGAYYVGELKGFPGPLGESKIWRIEPGTLNADCATSPACTVVASGFTSIVDIDFGRDGTLYVVEFDEASAISFEVFFFTNGAFGGITGGTVNACDSTTWTCSELATRLTVPTAVAVDRHGAVYATNNALFPGAAEVIALP